MIQKLFPFCKNVCYIDYIVSGRLYGSLLYKLRVRILHIEDTPIETIDEYTFLGVNSTLNELLIINSSLREFPSAAFKVRSKASYKLELYLFYLIHS